MKYFFCSHCNKQLINQNQNENEFWCDDCGKIYIVENDKVIEEEDQ